MLKDYNVITFKDKKKKNDVYCEINLPKEYRDVIKMTIGDKESYIKIKDFYSVCLLLVKSGQLESLLPNRERKVKKYKRQLTIIANKDIKKGERIIATYEVDVPQVVADNIKKEIQNGNNIKK